MDLADSAQVPQVQVQVPKSNECWATAIKGKPSKTEPPHPLIKSFWGRGVWTPKSQLSPKRHWISSSIYSSGSILEYVGWNYNIRTSEIGKGGLKWPPPYQRGWGPTCVCSSIAVTGGLPPLWSLYTGFRDARIIKKRENLDPPSLLRKRGRGSPILVLRGFPKGRH